MSIFEYNIQHLLRKQQNIKVPSIAHFVTVNFSFHTTKIITHSSTTRSCKLLLFIL